MHSSASLPPHSATGLVLNRRRIRAAIALLTIVCAAACSGESAPESKARPGQTAYDVSPIQTTGFASDEAVRRRVLYMPFGEAAARTGGMQFSAKSHYVFNRGNKTTEHTDNFAASQTETGDFEVHLSSEIDTVDFYSVGETVAVRQGSGKLRQKARRDMHTEAWCDTAFSGQYQALDLFRPRLAFADPKPITLGERPTTRFTLSLLPEGETSTDDLPPPQTALPVGPPVRWRELAQPKDLRGHLWVDVATGIVLQLKLEGRIEIADREVRPTKLTISYESRATDIGKVTAIKIPEHHVEEFERIPPPRDLLSFFRPFLPKEEL